ncbi:hypothetical protein BN1221_01434c [Brenneria goodwinii]|uniref:Uncharacterized protein n=1 Tax=Brenneria goodwinii TaxID=1109412 RepID=A0A0G4JTG7_9GAMM|nr:hypothetical protein BN1221_01434c [Brenneria goodwinii]
MPICLPATGLGIRFGGPDVVISAARISITSMHRHFQEAYSYSQRSN